MHQRTCVLLSLLAGLWLLGPATTPVAAQLPKEGAFMMFVGDTRELQMSQMQFISAVRSANVQVLVFGYTVVLKGTILRAEDAQVIMELARSVYPEFQVPGSQTAPGAGPPPPPPGQQPLPQGQGQGPLIINAMRLGGE